jgi:hypothetical protein
VAGRLVRAEAPPFLEAQPARRPEHLLLIWDVTLQSLTGNGVRAFYYYYSNCLLAFSFYIHIRHLYDFHTSRSFVNTSKHSYRISSFRFIQVAHIATRIPAKDITLFATFLTKGYGLGRYRRCRSKVAGVAGRLVPLEAPPFLEAQPARRLGRRGRCHRWHRWGVWWAGWRFIRYD